MTDAAPLRILLVDDSEDDLFLMKEALDSERICNDVDSVRSGEEALEYLRRPDQKHPSIVLLDINMPRMNGFETLEMIKADPDLRSIPIAMLTTSKSDEDMLRSYHDGACSFISKPLSMESLGRLAKAFSLYWTLVARTP